MPIVIVVLCRKQPLVKALVVRAVGVDHVCDAHDRRGLATATATAASTAATTASTAASAFALANWLKRKALLL